MHVILVHGWLSTPDMHFFPWLKQELEAHGHVVLALQMPNPARPKRVEWMAQLDYALQANGDPADTVLLGHSLGTLTILHYLQTIYKGPPFKRIVLCAGFTRAFALPPLLPPRHAQLDHLRNKILHLPEVILEDWFTHAVDASTLRHHARAWTCIHAIDDPVVPFAEGVFLAKQLCAELITENKGHLIEFSPQGTLQLPSALEAILSAS
ncbi:MAG: alpha/beta fold hydrolase [Patescibacteria group bacterium]